MNGWISVKCKLPKSGDAVIVYSESINGKVDVDEYYLDGGFYGWGDVVTHWMPLPEPPKTDRNGGEKG